MSKLTGEGTSLPGVEPQWLADELIGGFADLWKLILIDGSLFQ